MGPPQNKSIDSEGCPPEQIASVPGTTDQSVLVSTLREGARRQAASCLAGAPSRLSYFTAGPKQQALAVAVLCLGLAGTAEGAYPSCPDSMNQDLE